MPVPEELRRGTEKWSLSGHGLFGEFNQEIVLTTNTALLLRLTLTLLLGGILMPYARAEDGPWVTTPEGQTLLRPFKNAPYPHASREKGFTYDGKLFDAPTHYNDSTVGIFIPAGFRPSDTVDYVVHFHGWSNHVSAVLDHYELRQQFVQSGLNAILLVPQGPKDATDSGGGKLERDKGAFEALIREVTQFLQAAGKIHTGRIGHIALTTHSGGYLVTSSILVQGGLRDHITDVLLFDSSYGGLEGFTDWVGEGHGRRLVSIFTQHLSQQNYMLITLLQKHHSPFEAIMESDLKEEMLLPRRSLFLHTLDLPHDEIMQKRDYFALFLRTSALPQMPSVASAK